MYLRRLRRVLDQLEHLGAQHHMARRDREVAADLERGGVDLGGNRPAPDDITGQIARPLEQAQATGPNRRAQRDRVAEQEVRRGDRIGDLGHQETDPLGLTRVVRRALRVALQ